MKTLTDLACQNFLASHHERIENCGNGIFRWKDAANEIIDETSWLQIAHDVEWKIHWSDYFPAICNIVEHDWNQNSDVKYYNLPPAHRAWLVIHATYQQRAIALAKVLGKELAE